MGLAAPGRGAPRPARPPRPHVIAASCTRLLLAAVLLTACAPEAATLPAAPSPAPLVATPLPTAPTPTPTAPAPSPTRALVTPLPRTPTPAAPRYDLVILGAALIDGTGAPPIPDAAVAIRAGRIVAIGGATDLSYSADTPVRNLAGATILPGFVNAHAHTRGLTDDELRAWVRAGVTTLRDLGGPPDEVLALRDRIAAGGDPTLPRLVVAGPIVNVPGSFSTRVYGVNPGLLLVEGPDDARAGIEALASRGVDLIKIAVSGRTDVSWAELSNEELAAIISTATARGLRVSSHVDRASALRRAVEQGISDAAHSPRDPIPDDLIDLMVARGVGLVPTIAVYEGLAIERGNVVEWRRLIQPVMYDNLRRFAAAGGLLALGDDYGGAPGLTLGMPMEEIRHWAAAGLTPLQIIVAATAGGARVLGLEAELGTLTPGRAADILVVAGDPLADIEALARPVLVLHGGVVVRS